MKVYWNNICLISRFEKQYIQETLEKKDLKETYTFEYFGINREQEIAEFIQRDIATGDLPDVIVATESDLFHSQGGLLNNQHLLSSYKPWNMREELTHVSEKEKFFPLLYIPMVMIVNKERVKNMPSSIAEVLENEEFEGEITFGGLDNAAGKTLLAVVEDLYGKEKREQFLKWSTTTNMPVGAFKNVVEGRSKIGFVPTIFAMRAEVTNIERVWPKEGAIVIPSFVAIKEGADLKQVAHLFKEVITQDFIEQMSSQAGIIPCIEGTTTIDIFKANEKQVIYPSWNYIRQTAQEKGQVRK